MKILAVDTALGACSAAVLEDGCALAHRLVIMERGHAEALAGMVQSVMLAAGLEFADLDRLAVTTGPGTFTGQRVGLAFMRGLRIALKRPLVGITTLQAMGAAAMAETAASSAAVLHDAKRGEVYVGLYTCEQILIEPMLLPLGVAVQAICDRIADQNAKLAFAGTAASPALAAHAPANRVLSSITVPDALWVARLARERGAPAGAPAPLYLRPADARLPAASPK